MPLSIEEAEAAVKKALADVHDANQAYIKACKALSRAQIDAARENPHPWLGMTVYRVMGGGELKRRLEHGVVRFKDTGEDDFGNPHIPFGSYYVLVGGNAAKWLDETWNLELL